MTQTRNRASRIRPDTRTIQNMGRYLFKVRKHRKRTQRQVADAIGMPFQYVSDVENGKRGKGMNQFVATKWADYLGFPAQTIFQYLGLYDPTGRTDEVMVHLRGAVMAHSWVTSQRLVSDVEQQLRRTRDRSNDPTIREELADQREILRRVMALLHTPQNRIKNAETKTRMAG